MSPNSDPHADMDHQLRQRLRAVEDKIPEEEHDDLWFLDDVTRYYRGPLSEKQRLRVLRILQKYETADDVQRFLSKDEEQQ